MAAGYELPSGREVVGRGLQLAFEHASEIRRASLFVGLLVLATAGPAVLLFVVDLPRLIDLPWEQADRLTTSQATEVLRLIGPLYAAGALALLGVVSVSFDGVLMAVAMLASRAAGRPLTLRESLHRARQVFWRYGFAAFFVGVIAAVVSAGVGYLTGALGHAESIGSSLLGSFAATVVTAPFGYVLTAIVIGDVNGAAALGRSVTLARARPRLAAVVAAFAFLSSTLQVLGLGVAVELADKLATFAHPDVDLSGPGFLLVIPVVAAALVAFGSLGLTVSAIAAAPQIAAFLGLTHYTAGLDQARLQAPPSTSEAVPGAVDGVETAGPPPAQTWWQEAESPRARTVRWVTIPMTAAIVAEVIVAAVGIANALGR